MRNTNERRYREKCSEKIRVREKKSLYREKHGEKNHFNRHREILSRNSFWETLQGIHSRERRDNMVDISRVYLSFALQTKVTHHQRSFKSKFYYGNWWHALNVESLLFRIYYSCKWPTIVRCNNPRMIFSSTCADAHIQIHRIAIWHCAAT